MTEREAVEARARAYGNAHYGPREIFNPSQMADFSLAENAELRKALDDAGKVQVNLYSDIAAYNRALIAAEAEVVKLRGELDELALAIRSGDMNDAKRLAESALNLGAAKGVDE